MALAGFAIILTAAVSTTLFVRATVAHRQTQQTLAIVEQEYAQSQSDCQVAEKLVRKHEQETRRAAEACQEVLAKLHETEASLQDLRGRYELMNQGREKIESAARLTLARSMAAEGARRLTAQPAESLLLAERAMTYLNAQGEPVTPQLEQTLRDAVALTGDQALRGHSGPVAAIAVSRNGRWLVTGSVDKTVRLWDLHDTVPGESRELLGHESPVRFAQVSPDSRWAVTIDDQGRVILWDLQAPDPGETKWVLQAHQGKVYDLAVSSDSRWLAVGGTGAFEEEDNSVRLWDLKSLSWPDSARRPGADNEDGAPSVSKRPFVLRGHLGPVLAVAITPDCRWVVTGSDDETVRLFDLASDCPAASQVVLRQHAGPVTSIAISQDGRWMATGSRDQTVRLWDLTTPQPGNRATVLDGHQGGVHSVAISPTGRWLATAAHDRTVRVWNMNAVDPAASCVVLAGQQREVGPIRFTTDGSRLITGGDDGTVRVWNLETADPTLNPVVLRGHCGPIAALAVTPDGKRILTGCREATDRTDCLVRLWDLPIREVLEKARPAIARRINPKEQEQLLLETAKRVDGPDLQ